MELVELDRKTNIWIEKHMPKNINQISGSKRQVRGIIDWLKKYGANKKTHASMPKKGVKSAKKNKTSESNDENRQIYEDIIENDENLRSDMIKKRDSNTCSCMIITGDHGYGKTSTVFAILNSMNYTIKKIDFANISSLKDSDNFVHNILYSNSVYDFIDGKCKKKNAIIVDEIESISTQIEKNIVSELLDINNREWICPIIFIGNRKHKKIINEIKKESYHIPFYEPEIEDMMNVLIRIGMDENMLLEDQDVAYKIIEHSQKDYRRMISILQELGTLYGKSMITSEIFDEYILYSDKKDIDHTIFEDVNKLFTEYDGIDNVLRTFSGDRINIPLMVQQNHFMATSRYILNKKDLLETSSDISHNIAIGDIIDNYIYSQNWGLQDTYGFYSCVYPSYKLKHSIDWSKLKKDSETPIYNPIFKPEYPKDLNKTSTKKINFSKNVKLANNIFKHMSIHDYIQAIHIIKELLENNRDDECKELLKGYDCDISSLLYLLKIDKINGTKKEIPKHIQKQIKNIYTDPSKSKKNNKSNKY